MRLDAPSDGQTGVIEKSGPIKSTVTSTGFLPLFDIATETMSQLSILGASPEDRLDAEIEFVVDNRVLDAGAAPFADIVGRNLVVAACSSPSRSACCGGFGPSLGRA